MDTKKDNELIYFALNHWANWIETDDILMSAQDAIDCCEDIKIMTSDQMKMATRLRDLAIKELSNGKK